MKYLRTVFIVALMISTINLKAQGESDVEFIAEDGIRINATFRYPASQSAWPVIIFIHQGTSSRQEWLRLPLVNEFVKKGYAILAYDIRQHGKSAKDKGNSFDLFNNPKRAPLDLLAAIKFLENDSRINPKRIGIVGASIGGNLACVAASSSKYHVKSVVSLSPKTEAAQNLSGMKESIRPKNVFYIAGKFEEAGKREKWAKELYAKTTGERKIEIAQSNKHGAYIIKEKGVLGNTIIDWFQKTL